MDKCDLSVQELLTEHILRNHSDFSDGLDKKATQGGYKKVYMGKGLYNVMLEVLLPQGDVMFAKCIKHTT